MDTRRRIALIAVALSAALAGAAPAPAATPAPTSPGAAKLERMLAATRTVRAKFEQVLLDADLEVVKETHGEFALERPNRFRWDYAAPDAQTIVSDGKKLWIYDPALAQVTVKPLDGTLARSPAALLGGAGDLAANFTVTDLGVDGGLHWLALVPKVDDAEFETVRLGLGDRFVEVMELKDAFGQTTRILLKGGDLNAKLDPKLFRFTPPPGADVAGEGQ
jgi:outer membrane lipoprotein carrier protein